MDYSLKPIKPKNVISTEEALKILEGIPIKNPGEIVIEDPKMTESRTTSLETITGPLDKASMFERLLTSAEITAELITNPELEKIWFYTCNFALYRIEDGKAFLYFGENEGNPIFADLTEASNQLMGKCNYHPPQKSIDTAIKSALVRVKIDDLKLKKDGFDERSYFIVDKKNNEAQKSFTKAIYGTGVYDWKSHVKLGKTRVYALNSDYVKKYSEGSSIVRACYLDYPENQALNYNFYANHSNAYYIRGLRGIPFSALGNRQKNDPQVNKR